MDHRQQPEDLFAWLERNAALSKERGPHGAGLGLPTIEAKTNVPAQPERKRFEIGDRVRLRWRYRDAHGAVHQNACEGRVLGFLVGHYVIAQGGGVPEYPPSQIEAWPLWADIELLQR